MNPAVVFLVAAVLVTTAVMVYLTWLLFSRSLPRISKGGAFYLWLLGLGVTAALAGFLVALLRQA